ncbi:eukaryotic translation initiation factor 3 subunit F-like [Coffea eugenioides]|uniref:eukaryotic translation initiation factor 3 subunit F-like n=1 Tax=Coffea eugenioides TaxID=49369 RepID=UPI000F60878F|nr:eukaryotic translation initiation factor 3 subunit F-like [Coffea eugenioides]
MEGTHSGRGRGRGSRQPTSERGIGETSSGPNLELKVDPNVQIAAAMQQMTDLLAQERKEDEFIQLRQGTQTVAEYESQFTRLSKSAPELVMTEQRRIRRFVQGLNVEIQKDLAVAQINTFSEAVEKAQQVESAKLQVRNFQAKKRGFPGSSSGQGDKSTPPKFGRGAGGGRQSGVSRGAQSRGGQAGRGQRGNF